MIIDIDRRKIPMTCRSHRYYYCTPFH